MITTTTEVCNLALARLGARRIANYESDTSTEAKACRLHFEQVRDGLLRRHQWDFATTSKALSALDDAPLSEYAVAWQVPADCERIIRISTGEATAPVTSFARRGRHLLTEDLDACELIYVSNAVAIAEWDSLFIEAVALKLAARIAGDVTQNPALAAECNSELEAMALPTAQTADAREANSGEGYGLADLVAGSALAKARRRNPAQKTGDSVSLPTTSGTAPDADAIFEANL